MVNKPLVEIFHWQNTSSTHFKLFLSEPRGIELQDDEDDNDDLGLNDANDFELDGEPEMRDDDDDDELEPSDRQFWGRPARPSRRCLRYLGRSLRCLRWSDDGSRHQMPWWAFWLRG